MEGREECSESRTVDQAFMPSPASYLVAGKQEQSQQRWCTVFVFFLCNTLARFFPFLWKETPEIFGEIISLNGCISPFYAGIYAFAPKGDYFAGRKCRNGKVCMRHVVNL